MEKRDEQPPAEWWKYIPNHIRVWRRIDFKSRKVSHKVVLQNTESIKRFCNLMFMQLENQLIGMSTEVGFEVSYKPICRYKIVKKLITYICTSHLSPILRRDTSAQENEKEGRVALICSCTLTNFKYVYTGVCRDLNCS